MSRRPPTSLEVYRRVLMETPSLADGVARSRPHPVATPVLANLSVARELVGQIERRQRALAGVLGQIEAALGGVR